MSRNKLVQNVTAWNNAKSNSTTSSSLLDYFSKCGTYQGREQSAVDKDMEKIFSEDSQNALKLIFGTRLISRKPKDTEIEEEQSGFGRKDEFYKAIVWLHNHKPELLYKNLHLIPTFGCWKDFVTEPLIDTLNTEKVYELFANNLDNQLLRKYLPTIRSSHQVRSERDKKKVQWAKGLCSYLGINGKDYRKLKSQGTAHIWQKQMQKREWDKINFNGIPGKAMLWHTSRKGEKDQLSVFERHNQVERLREWVLTQNSVKFNGYPYELLQAASKNPSLVQRMIYDKQFETILESMKGHKLGNVLSCLDISGSMTSSVIPGVSAYDICISMGICFSALNLGHFADTVCAFSDQPIVAKLKGGFCERLNFIRTDREIQTVGWGGTNFQGVIDLLCKIKRDNPGIPAEEFPETLLILSDMEFDVAGDNSQTNYEVSRQKLESVGLKDIRIIWWVLNGGTPDFPSQMDDKGVYMISGFNPSSLKALMGLNEERKEFVAKEKKEETPMDGMLNFLSQPIFNLLKN